MAHDTKTVAYQKLLKKRETVLVAMKYHGEKANKVSPETSQHEILTRIVQLEHCYERFEKISDALLDSDKYNEQDLKVSNETITETYVLALAKFKDLVTDDNDISLNQTTRPHNQHMQDIKLPRITVPKFDGNYQYWTSFHDAFVSLVDSNSAYSSRNKMHFLKESLTGTALTLIARLPVSEANYKIAWKRLKDRFHNRRVIVNKHLQEFIGMEKLSNATAWGLRKLIDVTRETLQGLETIEISIELWDPIIVHILESKLDLNTMTEWERFLNGTTKIPEYSQLDNFLETQFRILDSAESTARVINQESDNKRLENRKPIKQSPSKTLVVKTQRCGVCNQNHWIYFCSIFDGWVIPERRKFIDRTNRCINCLQEHPNEPCRSKYRCKICKEKHNTKLHEDNTVTAHIGANDMISDNISESHESAIVNATIHTENVRSKLLATALVQVKDKFGISHTLRAFIDQGSESAFITERVAQLLCLPRKREHVPLLGMNDVPLGSASTSVNIEINSIHDKSFVITTRALISKSIISTRTTNDKTVYNLGYLKDIPLADPNFLSTSNVDILIGVDIYGLSLIDGIRKGEPHQPIAQNTRFGWLVFGALSPKKEFSIRINYVSLSQQLQRFWENEIVQPKQIMSEEHEKCKEFYDETTTRQSNGKYTVSLPFNMDKNDPDFLGETFDRALKRQLQLERRFKSNPQLRKPYNEFMREYLDLGHMSPCSNNLKTGCYLPHHAVIRTSSTTTKLRAVFDASAKSTNGHSLNDRCLAGPTIQPELFEIFLRWRTHKIALVADLEKMYRQIVVKSDDRQFQKILYRFTDNEPMQAYELNTVTYGTKPAPYMAIQTTFKLADDERKSYPLAAKRIKTDMYVDDLMSGADSVGEATSLQREFSNVFKAGNFLLRKWASNNEAVLKTISPENRAIQTPFELNVEDSIKTLGTLWSPKADKLHFKLDMTTLSSEKRMTKRKLLSDASKLFDPCGILGPLTIKAKILMQDIWKQGIDWDSHLTNEMQEQWDEYRAQLPLIEKISIDRWLSTTKTSHISLHGFCDSSEKAYCAAIYLVQKSGNETTSKIICAKTKVAPIQSESIPRLELCGAVILSELMERVANALNVHKNYIYLWTDSEIVLTWLMSHPSRWSTYVANRVSNIQNKYNNSYWRYVPTHYNPADIGSKGKLASQFINCSLWFCGPEWLIQLPSEWPSSKWTLPSNATLEEKKKVNTVCTLKSESEIIKKFSSLNKLFRITARLFRFIFNTKGKSKDSLKYERNYVTVQEIRRARLFWLKHVQSIWFYQEVLDVKSNKPVNNKSALKTLNPCLNENNLLIVYGRLQYANISNESKFPIILPQKSHLSQLIIDKAHKVTLHGTIHLTMASIRQEFWILNCRNAVKSHIHRCIVCYKQKPLPLTQLMAPLPRIKTTPQPAFSHCGIDFAGPIEIKCSEKRNAQCVKGYICVFVCMATKAIHLELCGGLDTPKFIAAVRRMISTRGICSDIYCDRGLNFQGAKNELPRLLVQANSQISKEIAGIFANDGITFHFIPPNAPSWGGQWESYVKLTKHHLRRVNISIKLTFEEMNTVLKQIEACINSRPLCAITSDINDFDLLTPGHFLIGRPLNLVPEPNLMNIKENLLDRWQKVQKGLQIFWSRWQIEYLHTLQPRKKWFKPKEDLDINDIVIVIDENTPPAKWMMGRVVEVHPGRDGFIRMVTLKTKNSTLQRPIVKLCRLPIERSSIVVADGGEFVPA